MTSPAQRTADDRQTAENFQPGQRHREPRHPGIGENVKAADVIGKAHRTQPPELEKSRINKQSTEPPAGQKVGEERNPFRHGWHANPR